MASLSISTALTTVRDSFDGTWLVRTVSDRVEFVLDSSEVSNLMASTDVGSRRVITAGTLGVRPATRQPVSVGEPLLTRRIGVQDIDGLPLRLGQRTVTSTVSRRMRRPLLPLSECVSPLAVTPQRWPQVGAVPSGPPAPAAFSPVWDTGRVGRPWSISASPMAAKMVQSSSGQTVTTPKVEGEVVA